MKIIVRETNGLQIGQRREDGYINATQMCQAGNKKWHEYWRLPSTQEYLTALAKDLGSDVILNKPKRENPSSALVLTFRGGHSQQGTWVHPEVAVDLAAWISVEFRILVNRWVREWMTTGKNPVQPQPAPISDDLKAALNQLERSIVSIRSQARAVHTCAHQPLDELLAKSLHSLSHNQLNAIVEAIHQMQALKQFASSKPILEPTLTRQSVTVSKPASGLLVKEKRLANINIKIARRQRDWLASTAQIVRQNNLEPVPAGERVYPQHLIGVAIALLQNSSVDLESAYSVLFDLDSEPVTINILMERDQQEWLAETACTIRENNCKPTLPAERVYPQHLIGVAIELLRSADVDWNQIKNVEDLCEQLNL
jgi:hypothetical protein